MLFLLLNLNGIFLNQSNFFNGMSYPYVGILLHSRYSIETLQNILSDCFYLPLSIRLYFGKWIRISSSKRDYLISGKQSTQNVRLNKSFLGKMVFLNCRQLFITIELIADNYFSFFPNNSKYKKLIQFLKVYLPMKINIIIKFKFSSKMFENFRLYFNYNKYSYYLGWTSYLR
jgi:predicted component of type VI protein secretion system